MIEATAEAAYTVACQALGEAIVAQRFLEAENQQLRAKLSARDEPTDDTPEPQQ